MLRSRRRGPAPSGTGPQLPSVVAGVARSVRGGCTLVDALGHAAAAVAVPGSELATDLHDVVAAVGRGWTLDDALEGWASRRRDPSVDLFVAACRLGHAGGGDLAAALDGAALSLSDRVDLEDEARSLATQARTSAAVLAALPVLGAACFALLDPSVARTLLATPAGWVCLLAGGALDALGALVMRRMVRGALR